MTEREPRGAPYVQLELSPCHRFAAIILAVHLVAAACCLAVLPGWPGFALAGLLAALGASSAWDRALLRGAHSAKAIEIRTSGEAVLVLADGKTRALGPVPGIGVGRFWVALTCGSPARPGILVTAGMLGAEPMRLLRLWALWGKAARVAWRQRPA